jgi:hypothetical protein
MDTSNTVALALQVCENDMLVWLAVLLETV